MIFYDIKKFKTIIIIDMKLNINIFITLL